MTEPRCTAPVRGHHTLASAVACPLHREEALREAAHDVVTTRIASIQPVERRALATDPTTSPDMLDLLASDTARSVRLMVARNPATSAETLADLARDRDPGVRAVASARLDA